MNNTRYEIKMTDGETLFTVYCHPDSAIQEIKDALADGFTQIQITKQIKAKK